MGITTIHEINFGLFSLYLLLDVLHKHWSKEIYLFQIQSISSIENTRYFTTYFLIQQTNRFFENNMFVSSTNYNSGFDANFRLYKQV